MPRATQALDCVLRSGTRTGVVRTA
jgi:hypothetical protein